MDQVLFQSFLSIYEFDQVFRFHNLGEVIKSYSAGERVKFIFNNTCNFPITVNLDQSRIANLLQKHFNIFQTIVGQTSITYILGTHSYVNYGVLDLVVYDSCAEYSLYVQDREVGHNVERLLQEIFTQLPASSNQKQKCVFRFHHKGTDGVESRNRELDAIRLASIKENYTPDVYSYIEQLVSLEAPYTHGKIILHHGPPGNGKTHLLRALAYEWSLKYKVVPEVVIDPEPLFEQPGYLMELLTSKPSFTNEPPFRFIIAEDCANLFALGCRENAGFSRLLNVVDGLLGSGQNLIFLFTANEEIGDIDPAVLRPGRCLQHLHIPNWSRADSERWLRSKGAEDRISNLNTTNSLADLYALLNGVEIFSRPSKTFGF